MDEDSGVGVEDGDGVGDEIVGVVGFVAGEIPIVAGPGERFGGADVEGMADERRTGMCGGCKRKEESWKRKAAVVNFFVERISWCWLLGVGGVQWVDAEVRGSVNGKVREDCVAPTALARRRCWANPALARAGLSYGVPTALGRRVPRAEARGLERES